MPTLSLCSNARWRFVKKSLQGGHPDLGQSLNNLATHYEKLGRHGDFEPLFRRSLAIREKVLGREHPDVARSLNNLASRTAPNAT